MTSIVYAPLLLLLFSTVQCLHCFAPRFHERNSASQYHLRHQRQSIAFPLASSTVDDKDVVDPEIKSKAENLKRDILALAASYDRGYGATPNVKEKMDGYISELASYNDEITGEDVATGFGTDEYDLSSPLDGVWQMVWTTAFDVLSIATPISTVSAIYQVIDTSKSSAVNIIDLIPRVQSFLPPQIPTPITRLNVQTTATRRGPKRVGLIFNSVEVEPIKNVVELPFPIKVDFPTKNLENLWSDFDSPGYFDVSFVDQNMLIIQQNVPGGCFISVKVPDTSL
mmetsp:Transcript_29204/g.32766  ORF Transcript_29204/g.32766 Transcript_29204/m.32766 type:complete len:283 (-) Transcript_29204:298-1146(-)